VAAKAGLGLIPNHSIKFRLNSSKAIDYSIMSIKQMKHERLPNYIIQDIDASTPAKDWGLQGFVHSLARGFHCNMAVKPPAVKTPTSQV
jgi:hypothetical protein